MQKTNLQEVLEAKRKRFEELELEYETIDSQSGSYMGLCMAIGRLHNEILELEKQLK